MDQDMLEHFATAALGYLGGKTPRTKREIAEAVHANGTEMSQVIHHLRGAGKISVIMEDDGVPRYSLGPATVAVPEPEPAPATTPPAPRRIAAEDEEVTRITELIMAIVKDGVPRTFKEMAQAAGLESMPDAVTQRLSRRGMRMVGRRNGAGVYTLQPKTPRARAPIAEAPSVHACTGACRNKALEEASRQADKTLTDYVDKLDDPVLHTLISISRTLRDALAAGGHHGS